jgi:hypothetical protein
MKRTMRRAVLFASLLAGAAAGGLHAAPPASASTVCVWGYVWVNGSPTPYTVCDPLSAGVPPCDGPFTVKPLGTGVTAYVCQPIV